MSLRRRIALTSVREELPRLLPLVFIGVCGYCAAVVSGTDWDLRPTRAVGVVAAVGGAVVAIIILECAGSAWERASEHRRGGPRRPGRRMRS